MTERKSTSPRMAQERRLPLGRRPARVPKLPFVHEAFRFLEDKARSSPGQERLVGAMRQLAIQTSTEAVRLFFREMTLDAFDVWIAYHLLSTREQSERGRSACRYLAGTLRQALVSCTAHLPRERGSAEPEDHGADRAGGHGGAAGGAHGAGDRDPVNRPGHARGKSGALLLWSVLHRLHQGQQTAQMYRAALHLMIPGEDRFTLSNCGPAQGRSRLEPLSGDVLTTVHRVLKEGGIEAERLVALVTSAQANISKRAARTEGAHTEPVLPDARAQLYGEEGEEDWGEGAVDTIGTDALNGW